jgi:hypothetical protein
MNQKNTADTIQPGDRVKVFLNSAFWKSEGWFNGIVVRIDPYTEHRSFYWVELEKDVETRQGNAARLISVLNPKYIKKTN